MNFFEFHIGDYAQATLHLSLIEHGAYFQLIKRYYSTEKPLPRKISLVCKHAGATNQHSRNAIRKVLMEFFELREDGWHNKRCDEEIAKFLAGEPERRARKLNQEARIKRHRDERKQMFDALRDAGQVPPWDIRTAELRALYEDLQRVIATPVTDAQRVTGVAGAVTGNAPATAPQSHSPLPTSHSPESKTKREREAAPSRSQCLQRDWQPDPGTAEELKRLYQRLDYEAVLAAFVDYYTVSDPDFRTGDWKAKCRKWFEREETYRRKLNGNNGALDKEHADAWTLAEAEAKTLGVRSRIPTDTLGVYQTLVMQARDAPRNPSTRGQVSQHAAEIKAKLKAIS
jgi:uncharacterized protein YdaU (DUF1376 family)